MPKDCAPPAWRICDAVNLLERAYNRSGGVVRDLAPDYEAVQGWLWVPSLYSVIEQGFKWLILSDGERAGDTHRLRGLYDKVSCVYKRQLDDAYTGYVELHDGIPYNTLEPFLDRLDVGARGETGRDQDGYTTWRYLLLEGFPKDEDRQPRVSIGAMLEVARAIRHILDHLLLDKDVTKFPTLIPRLHMTLAGEIREIADRYCV